VRVVTGSSIGTTKDEFRDYIRQLMPSYVLLVGAHGDFPVHTIPYPAEVKSYNYYVASSTRDHPNPDIPLGLFFVDSEVELANIVRKTISHESNSAQYPRRYYAHAGSREALPPWPVAFNEEILSEMHTRYFAPAGYHFTLATALDDTPNDVWTDINMINSGIHYMIYHGHGSVEKWSFGLGTGGLAQLHNTVYPVIFSFACLTGTFSGSVQGDTSDCLAQEITSCEHGAAAFFGAYNISSKGMNQLLEGAVHGLFCDTVTPRLGNILIHAYANTINTNTVNRYYPTVADAERIRAAWQFHLFGDPALRIRSAVTHVSDVTPDDNSIHIYPNPAGQAVTIESDREILGYTIYSRNGEAVVSGRDPSRVDLSALANGLFFISIQHEHGTYVTKIMKLW
jgi:hypothetical protein